MMEFIDEGGEGSDLNPRNASFVQASDWDDADGTIARYELVYGHYLTDKYVEYRNDFKNDNLAYSPSGWYSGVEGLAEPPLWQALFGEGSGDSFRAPGLLTGLSSLIPLDYPGRSESLSLDDVWAKDITRYRTFESNAKGGESFRLPGRSRRYPMFLPFSSLIRAYEPKQTRSFKCSYCGKRGHQKRNCPHYLGP